MLWQSRFQQFLHRLSAFESVAQQVADLSEMLAYVGLFVHQLANTFAGMGDTAVVTFAEILADSNQWKPGERSR